MKIILDTLFEMSDIISVHLPLNSETRGIINRNVISKMKESAIFINVARGAVSDEAALANAVRCGKIGGLGVDVYSVEPFPADHPFSSICDYDNVCLTPHMAWGAFEARERCVLEVCKNIKAFYSNERRCRID